ncbi:FAD-dependent monooxygenase [Streptomyces sp. NPDC056697]|uniref:FAD-dependent monooxygenase n=1 Tax=Streptomyces sp. NPDC056697 TaxID=3345915 RepID=UPI0036B2F1C5
MAADYLLTAGGNGGTVRECLGIGRSGTEVVAHVMEVGFEADLHQPPPRLPWPRCRAPARSRRRLRSHRTASARYGAHRPRRSLWRCGGIGHRSAPPGTPLDPACKTERRSVCFSEQGSASDCGKQPASDIGNVNQ